MKKKVIWYCTGCDEKCALKIRNVYNMTHYTCILFSEDFCVEHGYKPNWRKHEPVKRETEIKPPF